MRKWVIAAICFGFLAALFGVGSILASHSVDRIGVTFLMSSSGRHSLTTTDRTEAMGSAAIICGLLGVLSIGAAMKAKRHGVEFSANTGDSESAKWTCPHCHEENPGNFDECWKCQRNRPKESAV
jgi:hypothetical protein